MSFELPAPDQYPQEVEQPAPERLSQSGQMIGWGIYGGLLVIGFAFGIVTGYDRPKTIVVAKTKDTETKELRGESTKPTPKPETPPAPTQPISAPKDPPKPVVTNTPKEDPKPTPRKEDPKPPMPVVTTSPKTDPPKTDPPKKEDVKAVSFKEVLPVLRVHCLNCHGAGKGKPKADVDLTTVAKIMKSPSQFPNGKMVVAGKPDESDIYTSITKRDMPDGGKPKPSDDELKLLRNWILSGAKERRRVVRRRKPTAR